MRRWYAAALRKIANQIGECESGWELLFRLCQEDACDLVVASRSLRDPSGAQVLSMLRAADVQVPFVLVAPLCDGSVRALVAKLPNAMLVEDSLDAVHLAETAEALVTAGPLRGGPREKLRRALASRADARRLQLHRRRALG